MLEAILTNMKTKERQFLYLKNQENRFLYYGFRTQNNSVNPIDSNILETIYHLIKINDRCIYIGEEQDYQVYLDQENNLKHYLKNGVEDFAMWFHNNGVDARVYQNEEDRKKKKAPSKKFRIGEFILCTSLSALMLIGFTFSAYQFQEAVLREGTFSNNMQYNLAKPVYAISEYLNLDLDCINCDEAKDLILSSGLPESLKTTLANEDLLQDVFSYYQNTDMEYLIKYRLKNLKARIYEPTDSDIMDPSKYAGFYIELAPNVINALNKEGTEEVLQHEFIHLLQPNQGTYMFLNEATAEMLSYEYFDKPQEAYLGCMLNTELLMDTIGPKAIFETVFGGDDTNLTTVLQQHLNESDYQSLMTYLTNKPTETPEDMAKINTIIGNLYRNINGKDIHDDPNIYTPNGYHVSRYYFNSEKIRHPENYPNVKEVNDRIRPINEIFPDQMIRQEAFVK